MNFENYEYDDYLNQSFKIREKYVLDKFRPNYHFLPPDSFAYLMIMFP